MVNSQNVMPLSNPSAIVERLRDFQRRVRAQIIQSRQAAGLHEVTRSSAADTIYAIDAVVDPMLEAFCEEWAKTTPLILIAEGMENESGEEGPRLFPAGARESDATIRLIVDPIDGTRGLMYDKRPAWALAGVAPNNGTATRLRDIEVAVMTELPTSKMGQADVLWAIKGQGAQGVRESLHSSFILPPSSLPLSPSQAVGIDHGFASISNFFPGTKVLASRLMEHLVSQLIGPADVTKATVFDDQYICTGGQFYELIVGHDRFNADLRPRFYQMQNQPEGLCCHPYDCAAWLIAEEAGVILTDAAGRPLDGPLDTTTGLNWIGYANPALRKRIEPVLLDFFREEG
jgi:fructose-1,6-bisphosphatase/inositol monophosphatase family enzyme